MGNSLNKGISAAVAVLSASQAHSQTNLSETISLSDLLNSSNTDYSGSFSIGSLLASEGLSGAPVLNATITAAGFSSPTADTVSTAVSSTYVAGYSGYVVTGYYSYPIYSEGSNCYFWGGCYYYYYQSGTGYGAYYGYASYGTVTTITTTTNTDNTQDTIKLTAGGASTTGSVTSQSPTTVKGSPVFTGTEGNGTYGENYLYSEADTVTQGYYGALQAQAALAAGDLYTLTSTGAIAFDVANQVGATDLTSITLEFTVGTPVPLPPAAPLLGGGLAALAAATRLRQRRRITVEDGI